VPSIALLSCGARSLGVTSNASSEVAATAEKTEQHFQQFDGHQRGVHPETRRGVLVRLTLCAVAALRLQIAQAEQDLRLELLLTQFTCHVQSQSVEFGRAVVVA